MYRGVQVDGIFVTFEGIDGCGKSVQARNLKKNLDRLGYTTVFVRDPGTTAVSEKVRSILLDSTKGSVCSYAELMLYEAARAQLVHEIIVPALAEGSIVISDRFTDSTVAYQGYGRQIDLNAIETANRLVCGELKPVKTFVLDIPFEESLRRRNQAGQSMDRIEEEAAGFFEAVRNGYKTIAEHEQERVCLLDGTMTIEKLEQNILKRVIELIEAHSKTS